MRLLLRLVLLVAFSLNPLRAQSANRGAIHGRVVDQATERPLEYAAILLKDAEGRAVQRAATDAKGAFTFEKIPSGDYRVSYGPVGADALESAPIHVDGQSSSIELGALKYVGDAVKMTQVDVSAKREAFYSSIDRKTYNVGQDLKSVSGSASDLLQSIPSVQVDVDGNVSLRGNSSVLILVDGKPSSLMSTNNRSDTLAQLPADGIERIEVITNPSAKYKPDGTAGIINIVMKRQHKTGFSGVWRASVGNDSRSNSTLALNYNPGKYSLSGAFSFRQDDRNRFVDETRAHLDPTTQAMLQTRQHSSEHMRPLSRTAQLGADYRLSEADKLGVSASYNYRTFFRTNVTTNQSLGASGAITSDYDRTRADHEWQKTTEVKTNYTHSFADEGHELTVEARRERHWEQEDNHYANLYHLPPASPSYDNTLIKPTETGTELTADYVQPFADGAKLESGYAGEMNKNDMDFHGSFFDPTTNAWTADTARTNRFIYRDAIHAAYATFSRPVGAFGFMAGARVESAVVKTNQVTSHLVDRTEYHRLYPTLHLSYNLTDTQQLQLNYSHRVRRPESDDLNPFPEYQDPFNLRAGNPRLRPEETHSIEAGYQFHREDTTYLAAVFYRETHHAFTTVTRYIDAVTLLTTHENLSTNRAGGLELAATTRLGSAVSVNASANAYRSEIDASNLGFAGNPSTVAWDAKLNLQWKISSADSLQFDANYSAKRLTPQGYRLPTKIANLGWRHDFKNHQYAFTLTISDLFDSLKERTVISTPALRDDITRRRSSRIIYAGFVYNLGKTSKKSKDDLQFDTTL